MAIKVNTQTLTATRAPLPKFLKGLSTEKLQNLQSTFKPQVITELGLENTEYWPENPVAVTVEADEVIDGETLPLDVSNKLCLTTPTVRAMTTEERDTALSSLKATLLTELDEKASTKRAGGFEFGSITIPTDAAAMAKINGVISLDDDVPNFKVEKGVFVSKTIAEMQTLQTAMASFIQSVYAKERAAVDKISSAGDGEQGSLTFSELSSLSIDVELA